MGVRRTRITARLDSERGVFMISVAAELAAMHPQTLRMYEARGLIEPQRSAKGTRLYSHADVERLRRIQELTSDGGMNLAGVEKVFELEGQLERMRRKVASLERRAAELQDEIARLEEVRRSVKAELVRYEAVSTDLVPVRVRRAPRQFPFWVDDVDATIATAEELGGRVAAGPYDREIARRAVIADQAGAVLSVTRISIGG